MIKVGWIVLSKDRMGRRAKAGKLGLVVKLGGSLNDLAQVYWPHRRKFGWVKSEDMKVVS
jgi:hypothetical protein